MLDESVVSTGVSSKDIATLFTKMTNAIPTEFRKVHRNKRSANDMIINVNDSNMTFANMSQKLGLYGDEVVFSNIKDALNGSSISIPYSTGAHALTANIATVLPRATMSSFSLQSTTKCSEISSFIVSSGKNSIANISVSEGALAVFDACLPEISAAASSVVGSNYSVILSAPKAKATILAMENETQISNSLSGYTFDEASLTGPQYVTGGTITVFVVSAFFLIAALIGLNCTLSIQTPIRYANPSMVLPHTKEY